MSGDRGWVGGERLHQLPHAVRNARAQYCLALGKVVHDSKREERSANHIPHTINAVAGLVQSAGLRKQQ